MSKNTFVKVIEKEVERLNKAIDQKIIKGLSYRQEAVRHKYLLAQLSSAKRMSFFGLLSKRV